MVFTAPREGFVVNLLHALLHAILSSIQGGQRPEELSYKVSSLVRLDPASAVPLTQIRGW